MRGPGKHFSFGSDWSRGCCDISGPITSQGRSKREKLCITFDTQLKGVLMHPEDFSHKEKIDAKLTRKIWWNENINSCFIH